jgi:hypothetical protein
MSVSNNKLRDGAYTDACDVRISGSAVIVPIGGLHSSVKVYTPGEAIVFLAHSLER